MKISNETKITILEPGAWGTALGIILAKKNKVGFWYQDPKTVLKIAQFRENERLPGIKIPEKIFISPDIEKVTKNSNLIIIGSPSFSLRRTLAHLKKIEKLPPLLGLAKGIEKETLKLPSEIVQEVLGEHPYAHLSGPGFAKEVARGKTAKEVIASRNEFFLKELKKFFEIKPLKILTSSDLTGVQIAGALKNTLAIGISLVGAKFSDSETKKAKKDLIHYALKEMIELGETMGGRKETFLGPAGLGDLILTATSPLSRNFQFGRALLLDAEKLRKEIRQGKLIVEGFYSAPAFYKLGKVHKLDLPIINEVYKVIFKKTSPQKAVGNLISRIRRG